MTSRKPILAATLVAALSALPCAVLGQTSVLFSDDFETDTSLSWTVLDGAANGVKDATATFNFDYSQQDVTINGVKQKIPPAPNSGAGGTRGVKLAVNKDDVGSQAGISLFPTGKTFSGNYAIRADMWINYNGGPGGGDGSTELATFGINHSGTVPCWIPLDTTPVIEGDGLWFATTGEGGASRDYRSYDFDGSVPFQRLGADAGLIGSNGAEQLFVDRFPSPIYESAGTVGKHWVTVEVGQRNGVLYWKVGGFVIAERTQDSVATQGNIMIGTADPFSSVPPAAVKAENFVIFDNVRVINLDLELVPPTVTLEVTDSEAAEPGTDTASWTVRRTGDTTAALNVAVQTTGTAQSGVDFQAVPAVTIPAGQDSVAVTVAPLNDTKGEADETIVLGLAVIGDVSYEMRDPVAGTALIHDDGDVPTATLAVVRSNVWEPTSTASALFAIDFTTPNSTDTTVNYAITGTAQNGVDYVTITSSALVPANQTSVPIHIKPRNNTLLDGNRTVILTLEGGTRYVLGTTVTGTVTIRDDDAIPAATVVYSENFDADHTTDWTVNQGPSDGVANFFFDYSSVGVPPAPNSTGGTTRGLKLQANLFNGVFGGLSVSPTGKSFTGNYRLRFDVWQNFTGPLTLGGSGSTQVTGAGIGTAGASAQWAGAGSALDSVFFASTGDGGSTVDYRAYSTAARTGHGDGPIFAATGRNNTNPYYAVFGREAAPAAQLDLYPNQTGLTSVGAQGFQWRDVIITKDGNTITYVIDGILIATIDATTVTFGGENILFNHFDINGGVSADAEAEALLFGLIDNVRVEALGSPAPKTITISGIQKLAPGGVRITFTADSGEAAQFKVLSSESVTGQFNPETGATITALGNGQFQADVASVISATRFFRISF